MITKSNAVGTGVALALRRHHRARRCRHGIDARFPRSTVLAGMKIRIEVYGRTINATLADNEAARDFASLLPLTLTMNDLF